MTCEKVNWDQHDLKKHDFPLDDIPRLNCMDPQVDELIRKKVSDDEEYSYMFLFNPAVATKQFWSFWHLLKNCSVRRNRLF